MTELPGMWEESDLSGGEADGHVRPAPVLAGRRVSVTLFKPDGKYYTDEEWRIPAVVPLENGPRHRMPIGPYDMRHSPDFRRISGGAVLIPEQEPWGYPHLFPAEAPQVEACEIDRVVTLPDGPARGQRINAFADRLPFRQVQHLHVSGEGTRPPRTLVLQGVYIWNETDRLYRWRQGVPE